MVNAVLGVESTDGTVNGTLVLGVESTDGTVNGTLTYVG